MYRAALQKLFILLMLIVLPVFIIKRHNIFRDRTAYTAEKKIDQPVDIDDKHFVAVIPYSSHPFDAPKCLKSLLSQNYPSFEILFIDVDQNMQVHNEIQQLYSQVRKELSDGGQTQFASYTIAQNYYDAIHSLKDDTIVIHMEANSWFKQPTTLERLASIFTNSDIWLAYSPYTDVPTQTAHFDHSNTKEKWWKLHVRKSEWLDSPVKIFYAGLFKQMKMASHTKLKPQVQLRIFLMPLVEKAKRHITYIKDSLYYYDSAHEPTKETLVFSPSI